MYLTAYALRYTTIMRYKTAMMASSYFTQMSQWDWATVIDAGTLSLYAVDNHLVELDQMWIETSTVNLISRLRQQLTQRAILST